MKIVRRSLSVWFFAGYSTLCLAQGQGPERVALVIGVQNYTNVKPLQHSLNDANDMATVLKDKGFKVELLLDPKSGKEIKGAIGKYFNAISEGTVGIIYYSGHATVYQGVNYLIPADAALQSPGDLDDQCVKMDYVMSSINSFNNLNILILDACRSNAFPSFSRDITSGMAHLDAPKGSIVLFAAQPGNVASDGTGRNGLFTSKLLKYINEPDLDLSDVLKKVKQDVLTESKGNQLPSFVDNSLGGDFYFTHGASSKKNKATTSNPGKTNNADNSSAVVTDKGLGTELKPGLRRVENVKGEWIISNDITPVQAREKALHEAKIEAMRAAGVPEHTASSEILFQSDKKLGAKEMFESLTTVDISAEISELSIAKEDRKINAAGHLVYEVWINASVMVHTSKKDPGFNINISGIRENYMSPDKLTFDIKPWKEGYLTVFILNGRESSLLFPNSLEKQAKLEGGKQYNFPKNSKVLDYEVTAEGAVEINYLLFLFTKQEIPFVMEETPENILRFIAKIDPTEKCLKTYSILIKK